MQGTWKGYYQYQSATVRKIVGHEKTYFTIEIKSFDGTNFTGEVSDDQASGGMSDIGVITGTLSDTNIQFVKQMPFEQQITDLDGTRRKNMNKKHSPLYYNGTLIGENQFSGTWKFKRKWGLLFGLIPIYFNPGNGIWEMQKQ